MQVEPTDVPGLLRITPRVFRDERGFFLESYNAEAFAEAGVDARFVQDNHAKSAPAGVLRGFHFQAPPNDQAKLVWVVRGAVFDTVVDLREGSPTFGQWRGFVLSEENFLRLFIPRGFAHGYLTLRPDTEFMYKVDATYAPKSEGGLRWNDPDLAVDWPLSELPDDGPILSEKDEGLPLWREFETPFGFAG
ncbi:dTDP-4-dehydrorhamnose 3,5-epimerase [Desulfohalovibrio reitneri]|uniref:dTDP-4-dehydrorhamnose 3,5-epimerase n=1 Tax=Desulfohalovibrio reitneri TaxID=1307759 RepID=UPI0004A7718D|nr:dTDP-4-dehydrorhamnose 3,5-epimerase [Desulfohalovibrio reitneri]